MSYLLSSSRSALTFAFNSSVTCARSRGVSLSSLEPSPYHRKLRYRLCLSDSLPVGIRQNFKRPIYFSFWNAQEFTTDIKRPFLCLSLSL